MLAQKLFILLLTFSVIFQSPVYAQGKNTFPAIAQQNLTTLEDVQKAYPNARIQAVSVAEMKAIKKQLVAQTNQDGQPVTPVSPPPPLPPDPPKKVSAPTEEWDECRYYESLFYYHETAEDGEGIPLGRRGAKEPKFNFDSDFSFKGDKDFLIIVAVIGIVIVAALVVYAGAYIYQSFANKLACKSWDELGFRYTNIF
ncbi:MAG: hypothetical protein KDD43_14195, partial [Bdellovibrionales bacterium]|nr:hypothetical protein [Bdellovibrionales bacterium]